MLYHQQQQGKNRPSGNMISTTGMQNVGMGDLILKMQMLKL